jgi:peroxiredoxin
MRHLTLAGLMALLGSGAAGGQAPQVGDQALDFTLEQLDGGPVSLSDFRGKVVFLNFFGYN